MIQRYVPDLLRILSVMAMPLVSAGGYALPEDAEKDIEVEYRSSDMFLDQGLIVYFGTAEDPACVTQGTLKICGAEIRFERAPDEDSGLRKVTATGNPATFQQQPQIDQQMVHASGGTLVFDNVNRLVIADGDAEFSQAGTTIKHQHIEYNLETRRATASGDEDQRGRMTSPPQQNGN